MTSSFSSFSFSFLSCFISLTLFPHLVPSLREDVSYFRNNYPAASLFSQSVCFKRVPIPHFLLKGYSLPGSAFTDSEECLQEETQNQIRSSLETSSDDYRLPRTVHPVHYLVKICPQVRGLFQFDGSVEIELEVKKSTYEVTLNIVALEIKSVHLWHHKTILQPDIIIFTRLKPSSNKTLTRRKNSKFKDFRNYKDEKNRNNSINKVDKFTLENIPSRIRKITRSFTKENESEKRYLTITDININKKLQRITIYSSEELKVNNIYKLKISFSGFVNEEMIGLYKTQHKDNLNRDRISLVTQFQASAARETFPCFDEPGFKSAFTVILCREKTYRTISNMPKTVTIPRKGHPEMVWDIFKTSVPMATYLVAFAILDDYDYVYCNHSFIPFKVWAPSPDIHMTKFGCDVGPSLLDFFEDYFQIPYPLPKMDLIALRDFFALGMENWGLVTFLWDRLLIDYESPTSIKNQPKALETISHEMAHQWFGNLVTPSWWSDIWLNEGFATFLSLFGADYIQPTWEKIKEYVVNVLHPVLVSDSLGSSHPIVVNVSDPKDFFSIFDEISYGKGCFIVRMMMHILTEKAFQKGLRTYLSEMKYKSASQSDLWKVLTESGHEAGTLWNNFSIAQIMDTWILQEGYPVVSVTRLKNGNFAVTQQRHYQEPDELLDAIEANKAAGSEGPKWWIPLSIVTKQNPNMSDTLPKFWMNSHMHTIHLDDPPAAHDWFLLNVQQTGFFRVNYDEVNWFLLIQQLNDDHEVFDDVTRAQLIDDSFSLAYAEKISFEIPLDMSFYLSKEKSPFVITAALENLKPLFESFHHDTLYGEFKDLILLIMSVHYPSNGFVKRPPELPFVKHATNLLINTICKVYEPCIRESKQVFAEWTKNPKNYSIVDEDILETVFCVAVAEGGEREWEIVWRQFFSYPFSDKQNLLLSVLACSRHLWLNSRLLMVLTIDETSVLSKFYLTFALEGIAANPSSFSLAWDYIESNWQRFVGTLHEKAYFQAVVSNIWTRAQFRKVVDFTASSKMQKSKIHKKFIEEQLKNVNRKLKFHQRNYDEFFSWFTNREKRFESNYS